MPMQAESLEVLEKADVPPEQARAIVRAIEIELAAAKDTLATKHDLSVLRQDLQQEMSEMRQDLRQEMSEMRQVLKQEMSEIRGELRQEISEIREGMSNLRGELKAEIHTSVSGVTRQMYTALLGQMAVLLGFAYFFATHIAP